MKSNCYFIIFHDLGLGGIQKKILSLLNYVGKSSKYRNITFHLLLETNDIPNFLDDISNKRLKIHYWPKLLLFRRFQKQYVYFYYFCLLLIFRPKAVLLFSLDMLELTVWMKQFAKNLKTKVIFSVDTILSYYNQFPHSSLVLTGSQICSLVNRADRVLTQTKYSKNDLINNYSIDKNKIAVIPNWIYPIQKNIISNKTIDIIYFGRFAKQKRLSIMLNIFRKVIKERPNTQIYIIGGGDEENKIKNYIRTNKLKTVFLEPFTVYVQTKLENSKITVLTSEFEGHPIALLEAMSMGTVPIVLKYPGCEEYINHTKNGYIEDSEERVILRILQILENETLRKKIGKNSLDSVRRLYNQKNLVKTLNQLMYEDLVITV